MNSDMPEFVRSRQLMEEAEQTLRAIQYGTVDAFVVEEPEGHRVYTLEGSDLPYSTLVEKNATGRRHAGRSRVHRLLQSQPGAVVGCAARDRHRAPLAGFRGSRRPARLPEVAAGESDRIERRRNACCISPTAVSFPANFSFSLLSRDKSATGVLITDLTSQKQQMEFASRLQTMQDEERRRLARELHDSVGQNAGSSRHEHRHSSGSVP